MSYEVGKGRKALHELCQLACDTFIIHENDDIGGTK
jgi:hypothetical protein